MASLLLGLESAGSHHRQPPAVDGEKQKPRCGRKSGNKRRQVIVENGGAGTGEEKKGGRKGRKSYTEKWRMKSLMDINNAA